MLIRFLILFLFSIFFSFFLSSYLRGCISGWLPGWLAGWLAGPHPLVFVCLLTHKLGSWVAPCRNVSRPAIPPALPRITLLP